MTIIVTGGSGLVGDALKKLVNSDNNYIFLSSKDCNLTSFFDIDSFFNFYKPSCVIHLASKVAGLYGNMNDNYSFLVENLKINMNIIEVCKKYKVKRLVNILSTCIFPDDIQYPLRSSKIHMGPPHESNKGYAYSKRILHILSELMPNDTQVVNLIPTNLYGKNDNYNLEVSHVIPGLIRKLYENESKQIWLKGSGKSLRQFVYADDFAKIILHFSKCELKTIPESIIVSPECNEEISIKLLANLIKTKLNKDVDIFFEHSQECVDDGQQKKSTDSVELKKYLQDFEFTPLSVGIEETIKFFKNNMKKLRL
jgi:GDP-L-fucose synthase